MRISLIITVYNKEPFVKRCLDSIANQTEQDAQIIIVDDGSTDKSGKICDQYAKKYGWEVYHQENYGVSSARNLGMSKAKGDYIAFLDADDAFTEDALDVMTRITRHGYNIIQFGQYRYKDGQEFTDAIRKGVFTLNNLPRRWAMVWNKIYKREFIEQHGIRFIEGMQFGEDELFNLNCILRNGSLYHAPQTLIRHYLDDMKSLCRGQLNVERLHKMIEELKKIEEQESDLTQKQQVHKIIVRHQNSEFFKKFRYGGKNNGKYDIVYFLKKTPVNEELRYSLRSVEQNWQYHKVWFYGGCPEGIRPDYHVPLAQKELSKWERVRGMLYQACLNDDITEDFWLFNDDFFVMKPHTEDMPPQYNKTLQDRIASVESRHGDKPTEYSKRLRHLVKTLEKAHKGYLDYSVHKPILINRKKMLEVLDKFPDEPMSRALYGNYWKIGGVSKHDMKIQKKDYNRTAYAIKTWDFISTSDESFRSGDVGRYLRDKFNVPSRYEI